MDEVPGDSAGQGGTDSTHARAGRSDVDSTVVKYNQTGRGGVSVARRPPESTNRLEGSQN